MRVISSTEVNDGWLTPGYSVTRYLRTPAGLPEGNVVAISMTRIAPVPTPRLLQVQIMLDETNAQHVLWQLTEILDELPRYRRVPEHLLFRSNDFDHYSHFDRRRVCFEPHHGDIGVAAFLDDPEEFAPTLEFYQTNRPAVESFSPKRKQIAVGISNMTQTAPGQCAYIQHTLDFDEAHDVLWGLREAVGRARPPENFLSDQYPMSEP